MLSTKQLMANQPYRCLVAMPTANIFFRNLSMNLEKSLAYYKNGMPAEAVLLNILADIPLIPTHDLHLEVEYNRLCEKIGAVIFYSLRLGTDVESAINFLKPNFRTDLDDLNVSELEEWLDIIRNNKELSKAISGFSEEYDEFFLMPLVDFCEEYRPKYDCSISYINENNFIAIDVAGTLPSNVKNEAERAYYAAGEYILPDFGNGHSYFAITNVFDANDNEVLGSDHMSYIGLIK